MTIWTIRFLFTLLIRVDEKKIAEKKVDENVKHPAEFELR